MWHFRSEPFFKPIFSFPALIICFRKLLILILTPVSWCPCLSSYVCSILSRSFRHCGEKMNTAQRCRMNDSSMTSRWLPCHSHYHISSGCSRCVKVARKIVATLLELSKYYWRVKHQRTCLAMLLSLCQNQDGIFQNQVQKIFMRAHKMSTSLKLALFIKCQL